MYSARLAVGSVYVYVYIHTVTVTCRQTDRQTDRNREREREGEGHVYRCEGRNGSSRVVRRGECSSCELFMYVQIHVHIYVKTSAGRFAIGSSCMYLSTHVCTYVCIMCVTQFVSLRPCQLSSMYRLTGLRPASADSSAFLWS